MRTFRLRVLMLLLGVVVTAAVAGAAAVQRSMSTHAADRTHDAQALLIAMLDQETGLRGYINTRDQRFLEP